MTVGAEERLRIPFSKARRKFSIRKGYKKFSENGDWSDGGRKQSVDRKQAQGGQLWVDQKE